MLLDSAEDVQTIVDPRDAAESAGLRYVSDERPGIRRKRSGNGFTYLRPDGTQARRRECLTPHPSLAIPPAWTDVWICPLADGHIQATGRDARGRKQYRYHPQFREVRESTKYEHVVAFAEGAAGDPRDRCASTWRCAGCRAKRCWRPSCICWRRRSSASATTTMPGRTRATA